MSTSSTGSRARGGAALWLRWSLRDLRARWLQVAAIALVIALGTGSYAGLSSVTRWRRLSTDDAYKSLRMYDLRIRLRRQRIRGSGKALRGRRVASLMHPMWKGCAERLDVEIQVDASTQDRAILVPGLLYGVDLHNGAPAVNALYTAKGRDVGGVGHLGAHRPPGAELRELLRIAVLRHHPHQWRPGAHVRRPRSDTGVLRRDHRARRVGRAVELRRCLHLARDRSGGDGSSRHGQRPRPHVAPRRGS